jgi:hypothetical protein
MSLPPIPTDPAAREAFYLATLREQIRRLWERVALRLTADDLRTIRAVLEAAEARGAAP